MKKILLFNRKVYKAIRTDTSLEDKKPKYVAVKKIKPFRDMEGVLKITRKLGL